VSLRRGQSRALRGIERDLAGSDPDLNAAFLSFAAHAGRPTMPRVEKVGTGPLRIFARLRRRRTLAERVKDWCAQNWNDP
jgi:hypothetical protein